MLKKILHIQSPGKQKCMNASGSCFYNSGRPHETVAYIRYCISFSSRGSSSKTILSFTVSALAAAEAAQDHACFTVSASAAAEAHFKKGGRQLQLPWVGKEVVQNICYFH